MRRSRPRRIVQDLIGASFDSGLPGIGPAAQKHLREKLCSDSLAGFRGKSAPDLGGRAKGERAERASESRAQRPGKLLSDAPFTRPGKRSQDWISRLLLLQIASPASQDNGFEATPCVAVSRRGVGPGT